MSVCMCVKLVCLYVANKFGSHTVYFPHMWYIVLNQYDPASAQVRNSFALTVCWQFTVWRQFLIEDLEVSMKFGQAWYKSRQNAEIELKISSAYLKDTNIGLIFDADVRGTPIKSPPYNLLLITHQWFKLIL